MSTLNNNHSSPSLSEKPSSPTLSRKSSSPTLTKKSSSPKLSMKPSGPKLGKKKSRMKISLSDPVPPIPPLPYSPLSPVRPVSPTALLPAHTLTQWESNVNRLSNKERAKAFQTAAYVNEIMGSREKHMLYWKLLAFKRENSIRAGASNNDYAATLTSSNSPFTPRVRPRSTAYSSPIFPETPSRPSPIIPRSLFMTQSVPTSPAGNAWSGDHYWAPSFSPRTPQDIAFDGSESPFRPSSPRHREVYEETLDTVAAVAEGIMSEYGSEARLEAASRVLRCAAEEYDELYAFPKPLQTAVLLEKDKEKRMELVDLDIPAAGVALVWATKVYDDEVRSLSELRDLEYSVGGAEYSTPLKSIEEEMTDVGWRFARGLASVDRRRKGLAPDLEELEMMTGKLREMGVKVEEVKEEADE